MHVSPGDVARSGALDLDLALLRARFAFLDRSGLYRHPNPGAAGGATARAEPPIADVASPDLEEFLAFACDGKLRAEEYNTFLTALLHEEEKG